jgi:hypothetical protein
MHMILRLYIISVLILCTIWTCVCVWTCWSIAGKLRVVYVLPECWFISIPANFRRSTCPVFSEGHAEFFPWILAWLVLESRTYRVLLICRNRNSTTFRQNIGHFLCHYSIYVMLIDWCLGLTFSLSGLLVWLSVCSWRKDPNCCRGGCFLLFSSWYTLVKHEGTGEAIITDGRNISEEVSTIYPTWDERKNPDCCRGGRFSFVPVC